MRTKRFLSLLLVGIMLSGLVPAVYAPESAAALNWDKGYYKLRTTSTYFPSMPSWAAGAADRWYEYGMFQEKNGEAGTLHTNFNSNPSAPITRAELIVMLVRAMGGLVPDYKYASRFPDLNPNAWYYDEIAIAINMGIAEGADGRMLPNNNMTRQDAFTLLGKALGMGNGTGDTAKQFPDGSQVSDYAIAFVDEFLARGLMTGRGPEPLTIAPRSNITRAEAVLLLDNMFPYVYMNEPTYTGNDNVNYTTTFTPPADGVFIKGNLLVNRSGKLTLQHLKLNGDLIIGDGVDSSIVISNCEINGRIVIRGGGPDTVTISNSNINDSIYIASFAEAGHDNSSLEWKTGRMEAYEDDDPALTDNALVNHRDFWVMGTDRMSNGNTRIAITDHSRVHTINAVSGFTLTGGSLAGSSLPGGGSLTLNILDGAREYSVVNLNGVVLDELNIRGSNCMLNLNEGRVINARVSGAGQNAVFNIRGGTGANPTWDSAVLPFRFITNYTSVENLEISAPNVRVSYANNVRNLLVNNDGAIIEVFGTEPDFFTVGMNHSAVLRTAQLPAENATVTFGNFTESVRRGPQANTPNLIDRVNTPGLRVRLLPNYEPLPYALYSNMREGRSADEINITQAVSGRVQLTAHPKGPGDNLGYWVGFFIPAPHGFENSKMSPSVTSVGAGNANIPATFTVPVVTDPSGGDQLGIIIYLPVKYNPGAVNGSATSSDIVGQFEESLFINWSDNQTELTENLQIVSINLSQAERPPTARTGAILNARASAVVERSPTEETRLYSAPAFRVSMLSNSGPLLNAVLSLAVPTEEQKKILQSNFDNGVFHGVHGFVYTGAEAQRMILNSHNPLGLATGANQGLFALNRAVTIDQLSGVLENKTFSAELGIDSSGSSAYNALSPEGKYWVASEVLKARGTGFATAAAVKTAFDNAVKKRLQDESNLLNQINKSRDAAALLKIIETAANAAVLDFETGANPYVNYSNAQKLAMAQYLWELRQYSSIQEVIDAIRKYLGDPENEPKPDPNEASISRFETDPISPLTLAAGATITVRLVVTLSDGSFMSAADVAKLNITVSESGNRGFGGWVHNKETNEITITALNAGSFTLNIRHNIPRGRSYALRVTVSAVVTATRLEFRQKDVFLKAGEIVNLRDSQYLTVLPAGASNLTWSSSDPSVAVVDPRTGVVTAGASRSTTPAIISVTAPGAAGSPATINVWVYDNENDIFLNPVDFQLFPGSTREVEVIYIPPLSGRRFLIDYDKEVISQAYIRNDILYVTVDSSADPTATPYTIITVNMLDANGRHLSSATTTVRINNISVDLTVRRPVIENRTAVYSNYLTIIPQPGTLEPERYYWSVTSSDNDPILFRDGSGNNVRAISLPSTEIPDIATLGIGTSTITLRTNADDDIIASITLISAPRGISGVRFYEGNNSGTNYIAPSPNYSNNRVRQMFDQSEFIVRAEATGLTSADMLWIPIPSKADYTYDADETRQLASYDNGRITGVNYGRVKYAVVPKVPAYPSGWELTGENLEGRWYGQDVPLFTALPGGGYEVNPLIDVELSGLQIKENGVLTKLRNAGINDQVDYDEVNAGEQIICDVNGRELTRAGSPNPNEHLVVKSADLTGNNTLYVWIKALAPTISLSPPYERTMTKSQYDDFRTASVSGIFLTYSYTGGYEYKQVESSTSPLDEFTITAWTYINGANEEKGAIPNLLGNQFGRLWSAMVANINPTAANPTVLSFSVQAKYRINDGFNYGTTNPQPETLQDQIVPSLPPNYVLTITADTIVTPPEVVLPRNGGPYSDFTAFSSALSTYMITNLGFTLNELNAIFTGTEGSVLIVGNNVLGWTTETPRRLEIIGPGTCILRISHDKAAVDFNVTVRDYPTVNLASEESVVDLASHPNVLAVAELFLGTDDLSANITYALNPGSTEINLVPPSVTSTTYPFTTTPQAVRITNISNTRWMDVYITSIPGFEGASIGIIGGRSLFSPALAFDIPEVTKAAQAAGIDAATATFSSSDGNLIIDSSGMAMPVAEGDAEVTITSSDGTKTTKAGVKVGKQAKAPAVPKSVKLRSSASVAENGSLLLLPYFDITNIDPAAFKWSSSNPAVATVDENGLVTGVKSGKATIKLTVSNTKLSASCSVTVTNSSGATAITLNKNTLSLAPGKSSSINVKYQPSRAAGRGVTWVSSDENVARVGPNGSVTAVGNGAAVITAVCDLTGVTAKCIVNVSTPASRVRFDIKTLQMTVGDESVLAYTIAPENAEKAVSWKSSNTKVVTVDENGRITAVGPGTATITVRTASGKTDKCKVTVKK
ncbi:MAG: Ig-like domain-containing protein [Oscillospiraceae bacterium]|nr:Ig-like domain-containing protein [Oscillospiraceae bacterium]